MYNVTIIHYILCNTQINKKNIVKTVKREISARFGNEGRMKRWGEGDFRDWNYSVWYWNGEYMLFEKKTHWMYNRHYEILGALVNNYVSMLVHQPSQMHHPNSGY